MEILTLVLANIRHKKGSFISIMVLMLIIVMSITSIISINDNNIESIEDAHNYVGTGEVTVAISATNYTDKIREEVSNHKYVEKVDEHIAINGFNATFGNYEDGNAWLLLEMYDGIRLYNDELNGYENEIPELKAGEIYITQGIRTNMGCNVGDTIAIETIEGYKNYVVKGIVVEPMYGTAVIGWKQVFISEEDFEILKTGIEGKENYYHIRYFLNIHKDEEAGITDREFKRQLNLDTGIEDNAFGALLKEDSIYYTNIYSEVITSALMVFMIFLVVIVLIVMRHNITTNIEMDYVNFGILKTQGFSDRRIRMILILQYFIAEIVGIIIGICLAIPLVTTIGNIFQPITGILSNNNISIGKSMIIIGVVLVISAVFIYFSTINITKISPVNAITGGKGDVYFDSRLNAPITQKGLMASIAFRQFTSNKKRYIGAILIVSILVFFMMTASALSSSFSTKAAIEAMGEIVVECEVYVYDDIDDNAIKDIENIVEKHSEIENKYYIISEYVSINGEGYLCTIYKNPEVITPIEGRAPIYDNEIIITPILSEELGIEIGDKVIVSGGNKKAEFIVSGYFQSMNDLGKAYAMSLEGGKKVGINSVYMYGFSLKNPEKAKSIADEINSKYSDVLVAEYYEGEIITGLYKDAVVAIQIIIYGLSVIFALIVVVMICSKLFLQERKDIGIYKSLGYSVISMRIQFAIRFLVIAIIGAVFGYILSMLFTEVLLGIMLKTIGLCAFKSSVSMFSIVMPVAVVCISFFVFAFFASRKIKTVEPRELVVE